MKWPKGNRRGRIQGDNQSGTRMVLGVVKDYAHGMVCSSMTHKRLTLCVLLNRLMAAAFPSADYTSCQLARDLPTRPHVDPSNVGINYLAGLGSYTGGDLWVHAPDVGHKELEVKSKIRGCPRFSVGDKLKGEVLPTCGRITPFDPSTILASFPASGTRFSMTFYTAANAMNISCEDKRG